MGFNSGFKGLNSERISYPSATLPTTDVMWTARFPFRQVQAGFFGGQSGTVTLFFIYYRKCYIAFIVKQG